MRILLLSLYYPPLNTIAAQRIKSFEKYLMEEGVAVDVITRYYDPEQQKGKSMLLGCESPKGFKEDYISKGNVIYTNFDEANSKLLFSKRLPPIVKGIYNYFNIDVYHYGWIKYAMEAFNKELSHNKYDFIISSYGPPVSMLLAKEISDKNNIPYLIDFRDSYIDEKDVSYHLFMKRFVLKKMLSNSRGLIFSTDGMRDFFSLKVSQRLKNIPSCVVYNGVEESSIADKLENDILLEFNRIRKEHSMILLHTGTLYDGQNITFFIDSVNRFNAENQANVAIVFLGLAENRIKKLPEKSFIYYLSKVNHSTAMFLQKEASALLLPIWDGRYTGFSGKTQEYLFSGNYIITSPEPQKDLKLFLDLSPNVYISNSYNSFSVILKNISEGVYIKLPMLAKEKLYRLYWVKQLKSFLINLK